MKVFELVAVVFAISFSSCFKWAKAQCDPGFYSDHGKCSICPRDYYCPGDTDQPLQCPPGYSSFDGEAECSEMTEDEIEYRLTRNLFGCGGYPGYYCSGSTSVRCRDGKYCPSGSETDCSAGYRCPEAEARETCPTGFYSDNGMTYCYICPAGSWCTGTSMGSCSSGQYSLEGSSSCTTCSAGYKCPSTSQGQQRCAPGEYQPSSGQTSCNTCPEGQYCPNQNTSPSTCSSGYYSGSGWSDCKPCPAGSDCSGRTESGISTCSTGYYSKEGVATCSQCTAGYYCPNADFQYKCPEGYYSNAGATACTACETGYYCTDGARYICPHLFYTDQTGSTFCRPVPTDYIISSYNGAGTNNRTGGNAVTQCGVDQHTDDLHLECFDCDNVHMCSRTNEVVPCPFGHIKLNGDWFCSPCPPGSVCIYSGGGFTEVAMKTYMDNNGYNYSIPRSSGYLELGGKICPPNNYCSEDGVIYHICAHGTYPYFNETDGCKKCAQGSFCMTSFNKVVSVTSGSQSALGDSFPRFQPQGKTWNGYLTGYVRTADYTSSNTALGRIDDNDSTSYKYPACPVGYSCSETFYSRCPSSHLGEIMGTENPGVLSENQAVLHNYDQTAEVTFAEVAAADLDTDSDHMCIACNGGYSCTLGSAPSPCSAGTYSPVADPKCHTCPAGYYCEAKSTKPTACAANKYNLVPGSGASTDCQDCPTGLYSKAGSPICEPCPGGYECTSTPGTPVLCPIGYYSTEGETTCSECRAGYACGVGTSIATPPESLCPKGFYCEQTGSGTLQKRCPAGKYGIGEGAIASTDCLDCPPGFVCREGTDDFTKYPCPQGNYCPQATSKPTQCPAGTWNPETGGWSLASCKTCPAGYFCPIESKTITICPAGSFCPSGTTAGTDHLCPAGTYSGTRTGLKIQSECLPCPMGHYCPAGSTTPTAAAAGYYIPYMGSTSVNAAKACPPGYPCTGTANYDYKGFACTKGYYCPPGSSDPTGNPCPAGTYSDRTDLWDASQCTACPSGYYCLAAATSANWVNCPLGYYCPPGTGSSTQYPCPTGTTGDSIKLKSSTECTNCTAGGGCGSGSSASVTCAQGYYCPAGTTTSTPAEYQAPAGSYIDYTGATSQYDNKPCGLGHYCPTGSTAPTICPNGTYSDILRASSCTTCPAGYKCPDETMTAPTPCGVGYYSTEGSLACTLCPEGYYCHQTVTSQVTMLTQQCPAGTICSRDVSGTNYGLDVSPNLVDHACPAGKYCEGGYAVSDCPAGTYNPIKGRKSLSDCLQTPAGYYTVAGATEFLSTKCAAGYYCLAGSTTATEVACPAGTFRGIEGGRVPEDCAICKTGFVCASEATVTPTDCGAGNYCPLGTVIPELCPIGTFSSELNLPDSRSCTKCSIGHYCGSKGMTAVTTADECDSGFYCIEGAIRPDPTDGITGKICPAGGFCLKGATSVSSCPTGTYNPAEGANNSTFCISCLPGKYCAGSNNPAPAGDCEAGFYCPAGSSSAQQNSVTAGHYAPVGSDIEVPCPRGTYQPSTEQESCIDCEAGAYCPDIGMTASDPCPAGYYCESKATQDSNSLYYEARPCPVGTYNAFESKSSLSDCVACDAGQYCDEEAMIAPKGDCAAGYFCTTGSPFEKPAFDDAGGNYGMCPTGHHCAAATENPTACLAGTYSAMTKSVDDTNCKSCEPGSYCETAGLSAPTGYCEPGYYCAVGSTSIQAAECTATNYCPQGSANEERCPIGFYNTLAGAGSCVECEAGYTCFNGEKAECPAGFYCP